MSAIEGLPVAVRQVPLSANPEHTRQIGYLVVEPPIQVPRSKIDENGYVDPADLISCAILDARGGMIPDDIESRQRMAWGHMAIAGNVLASISKDTQTKSVDKWAGIVLVMASSISMSGRTVTPTSERIAKSLGMDPTRPRR